MSCFRSSETTAPTLQSKRDGSRSVETWHERRDDSTFPGGWRHAALATPAALRRVTVTSATGVLLSTFALRSLMANSCDMHHVRARRNPAKSGEVC
jgi:hypothetical protein